MKSQACIAAAAAALFVMPALAQAPVLAQAEPLALAAFAEALDTCTPAEGALPVPAGTELGYRQAVTGADAEGCHYVRDGMDGIRMACAFSPEGRAAYAETLRAIERGDDSFARHEVWDRECAYVLADGERLPVAGPAPAATFVHTDMVPAALAIADALESCTPAVRQTLSAHFPGLALVQTVVGEADGLCGYVQTKPFGTLFECAFSPAGRQAYAESLRWDAANPESLETAPGLEVYGPECVMIMYEGTRVPLMP